MSIRLRALIVAAVLGAVGLALLIFVHLPPVRASVRDRALSWLQSRNGIIATVEELSYNLLTLDVRLRRVTAAAEGWTGRPFLTADEVRINLPWRALLGTPAVESIELSGATISIVREKDGRINLPASDSQSPSSFARFNLGRVSVQQANLRYQDTAGDFSASAGGIALEMMPAANGATAGPLTAARGLSIRTGDIETNGSLSGSFSYDGTSLGLAELVFASSPARVQVDGRVNALWTAPSAALTVAGDLSLAELSATLRLAEPVSGSIAVTGAAEGPLNAPRTSFTLASDSLAWRHLTVSTLAAKGIVNADAVEIEASALEAAGGTVETRGQIRFAPLHATASAEWRGLSARTLAGPSPPMNLSAVLSGRGTADWIVAKGVSGLAATIDVESQPGGDVRTGSTAIGVGGSLALVIDAGRWRIRHSNKLAGALSVEGHLAGALSETGFMNSTIAGLVTVSGDDMSRIDRVARAAALEIPAWSTPQAGRLSARIELAGTLAQPSASGEAGFTALRIAGSNPFALHGSFVLNPKTLGVRDLLATMGKNVASGNADLNLVNGRLGGSFDVALFDFAAFGNTVAEWHPSGELAGRFELGGTRSNPSLRGTLSGTSGTFIELAGQSIAQVALDWSYADQVASISRLQLEQRDGGQLRVAGTYEPEGGRHKMTLQARSFVVSPIAHGDGVLPVRATIDGTLETGGTLDRPDGGGHLVLTGVGWKEARLDRADAEIALSESGVAVTIRAPTLSLLAEARVKPLAPYGLNLAATVDNTNVRELVRMLGAELPSTVQQIEGTVSARVDVSGSLEDTAHIVADLDIARLELKSGEASLRLANRTSAHYEASKLTVGGLRLETGLTAIEASGEISRTTGSAGLSLTIDGDLQDFRPWLALAGPPPELSMNGAVTAVLLASGSIERTALTGRMQLENGSIGWPGYPATTSIGLRMSIEGETIDVTEMTAGWQEATAVGNARVPLRLLAEWLPASVIAGLSGASTPASLQARVDNVTPAALAPFAGDSLDKVDVAGRASLQIDLNADAPTLERLNGSILLGDFDLTAKGLPISQDRPTRVDVVGGELQVVNWTWSVAGSRIEVGGSAQLAGERSLNMNVGGQLDLRVIGAFLPDISTSGVGDLSVAIRGTLAAPLADGSVQLRDGELRLVDPQIAISDANGRILLRPNHLEVIGLEGDLNGGRFAVIGSVEYRDLDITGGSVAIDSKGVALDIPAGMRTEIDSTITVAFANRIQVSGNVEVARGGYREPLSLAVVLAMASRDQAAAPTAGARGASLFEQIDLNVAVASADDLIVDNNYGRMDIGLDVRIVGTAARPSIVGRASIREGGTLFLGGRSYLVERGVIDFTDSRAIIPELDISARTRLRGPDEVGQGIEYDISLDLAGTPEALEVTLSSDPSRGQADIVSLLATGRLADQAGGIGGAAATEQALALLSGEALGFAAQAIGLDSIRIERDPALDAFATDPAIAAEVDPAQRLSVSRRIADVEITLSQNLRDTGRLTWIVAYSPTPVVELRTVSRDDRSRSYEVRHDVTFGGAPRPAPPRKSVAGGALRVADVGITGDPKFPLPEVEKELHLRTGDRFDFYRWQEDRSRLRRFYVEHGHLEARISPRRAEPAAGNGAGVFLEYDIEAGPVAHLELEGHVFSERVIRELEGIWSNTIIDVALATDLKEAVRRHLAEEGHLRPEVEVSQLQSDEIEKRIRISIVPGPRSSSRRVEFAGNEYLSAEALDEAAARLGAEAWLTPGSLASEVAGLYRQEGLLAARVTAGPVEFLDDEALLTVRIEEGAQFRVARVVVSGAKARSEGDVLEDFGIVPGIPYTPAAAQQARLAVGRAYDRRGFNSMTSTIDTVSDLENAAVELRLTINEGPQQVLETITVSGGRDVRPGVISDALGLSTGAPVDMDAWYAGRRRLFRTGLFQRVDIEPVPIDAGKTLAGITPIRAEVTLQRRAPWRLRYGVDVTDESAPLAEQGRVFGAGLSANLERYGLIGRAGTAGMGLRANNDQRIVRGFLTLPSFLGRSATTRLFVSRSRDLIKGEGILSVVADRTAFTAEQRFQVRRNLEMAYGYEFERNHTFDPDADPDDPFGFDIRVQAARLTATLVFDTRTDPFAPAGGLFHSSTVEYAPERLGSDVRFAKYSLQQFVFAKIAPGLISASAFRLGIGRGFGQRLLVSERFLAGGANTVRGYADDSVGGYDFFGDPIRGEAVAVLNQEVRFPVFRWLGGAAFVDAGEVFDRTTDVSLGTLDVGAGGGLRFSTPVGLFRLDLATPVPRRDRALHWYFAFGHTF